ncbi:MAG TPA: hypothetical protein P5056_00650 [Candidatus Paceibacterota bacterium]|nr:hypothetical protein [Candidatus Paceibacterota bacterium]
MRKNKGASLVMILVLIAFIAIPYFYGNRNTKEATTTEETQTSSSWLTVYNPRENAVSETTDNTNIEKPAPTKTAPIVKEVVVDPNQSKYAKKIQISSVSGSSSYVKNESMRISNVGDESVPISGFVIETYEKETFKIPKGYELPGTLSSVEDNIVLKSGDYLDIYVGLQDRKINFRENLCTGYFDQFSDFGSRLNHSCPKIDISGMLDFSDNCIKILNDIPKCKIFDSKNIVENDCNDFANAHYNYVGCVKDFSSKTNFYSKRWLAWMQRDTEFFRNDRGLITLRDTEGKTVATYSY